MHGLFHVSQIRCDMRELGLFMQKPNVSMSNNRHVAVLFHTYIMRQPTENHNYFSLY